MATILRSVTLKGSAKGRLRPLIVSDVAHWKIWSSNTWLFCITEGPSQGEVVC